MLALVQPRGPNTMNKAMGYGVKSSLGRTVLPCLLRTARSTHHSAAAAKVGEYNFADSSKEAFTGRRNRNESKKDGAGLRVLQCCQGAL